MPCEITFETTETNWVCMIVHHHHQRTDLGGIICQSLAYLLLGQLCHAPPLQNPKYASDVNMPSQTK